MSPLRCWLALDIDLSVNMFNGMRRGTAPLHEKSRMAVLCLALLAAGCLVAALPLWSAAAPVLIGQPGREDEPDPQSLEQNSDQQPLTGSVNAMLACSWTEPVAGRGMSMIFAGDCLLACKPGTLVHLSAKLAGRDAVISCVARGHAVRGKDDGRLGLVVPE